MWPITFMSAGCMRATPNTHRFETVEKRTNVDAIFFTQSDLTNHLLKLWQNHGTFCINRLESEGWTVFEIHVVANNPNYQSVLKCHLYGIVLGYCNVSIKVNQNQRKYNHFSKVQVSSFKFCIRTKLSNVGQNFVLSKKFRKGTNTTFN
jgi:hypothetical protein